MQRAPLVLGHACAAGEAPANTLAGVRQALDAGCEGIEIDVQLCAEGIPMLMHDETVDRTTNLKGPIRELGFAALQAADAGNGEIVPSLDQLMELVAGRLTVMCELKATPGEPEFDQRLVDAVVAVIEKHDAASWSAIHSFNPDMVERARRTQPRISAAIIAPALYGDDYLRLLAGTLKRNGQAISMHHECVNREMIIQAKRRQLTVWTWTLNTPELWAKATEAGVDGIMTDYPHTLREWLASQ